jgi:hypothetical protein
MLDTNNDSVINGNDAYSDEGYVYDSYYDYEGYGLTINAGAALGTSATSTLTIFDVTELRAADVIG